MRSRAFTTRMAALMGVGSLAVHQLRFVLWYGKSSGDALSSQGHTYLAVVGPVVVGLTVLAVTRFLERLARGAPGSSPRLRGLWGVMSVSLVAMYSLQESLEGMLSSGHASGIAGVFGNGGWLAVPLSIVVGLALALALRGAARAAGLLGRARAVRPHLPAAPPALHAIAVDLPRHEAALVVAGPRAPPVASA